MTGIFASGRACDGWCCGVCHTSFPHDSRRYVSAFLGLVTHKTLHLHRPFTYRHIEMACPDREQS